MLFSLNLFCFGNWFGLLSGSGFSLKTKENMSVNIRLGNYFVKLLFLNQTRCFIIYGRKENDCILGS